MNIKSSASSLKLSPSFLRLLVIPGLLLGGCSAATKASFANIGSTILSSAGVPVSSTSMTSMFDASEKIGKSARGLTDEQEYYLGRGVAAVVLSKYRPLKNDGVNRYVNKVGRSVAVFSDRPETFGGYHFAVLDTMEINAVSGPGGFVFITKGFLNTIPNEDALAAVLAHEVGHIVLGHGTAAISQANLTSALTSIGKEVAVSQGGAITSQVAGTFGDSITDISNSLLENGYSRSQEYEADEYAAVLLGRAGYNQAAIVTMLKTLESVDPSTQSAGWYSTHPKPEKRQREVQDEVEIIDSSATPTKKQAEQLRANRFNAAMRGLK